MASINVSAQSLRLCNLLIRLYLIASPESKANFGDKISKIRLPARFSSSNDTYLMEVSI